MRFWDSSALVPLLAREPATDACERLLCDDPEIAVWWGTRIECAAALVRKDRESGSPAGALATAWTRLQALAAAWIEIVPSEKVRERAERNLRVHALRSADALQLAAAMEASGGDYSRLPFICRDTRLGDAAQREGFPWVTLNRPL